MNIHNPLKFNHRDITATGAERAHVRLDRLETLWINTGTLCNLACTNCYIDSSPKNDKLVYLTAEEVSSYLDEIEENRLGTAEIGFTGGEPFMNPDLLPMVEDSLARGFKVLVLTNGMKPLQHRKEGLEALLQRFGSALRLRVSVDHYQKYHHEKERGLNSWEPMLAGLQYLTEKGFALSVAGRFMTGENEAEIRAGFSRLFQDIGISLEAQDPADLILFPEMDGELEVPEITSDCWEILGVDPGKLMCATSRMVIKRKGAPHPSVVSCTLLPDDPAFELGESLLEAAADVKLNHPHCSKFCVLGGASCSNAG